MGEIVTGGKAILSVVKAAEFLSNWNTDRFIEARDEEFRQWVADLHAAVRDLVQQVEVAEQDFDALVEMPEFQRLFVNVAFEARREALDDRRALLAHVGAALLVPGWTIERKARVERAVRRLDAEDVLALRALREVFAFEDPLGAARASLADVRYELWRRSPSRDGLELSGCVRVVTSSPFGGTLRELEVSDLGCDVLEVTRGWRPDAPPPFMVPGAEDDSARERRRSAIESLEAMPQLREIARLAGREQDRLSKFDDSSCTCLYLVYPADHAAIDSPEDVAQAAPSDLHVESVSPPYLAGTRPGLKIVGSPPVLIALGDLAGARRPRPDDGSKKSR